MSPRALKTKYILGYLEVLLSIIGGTVYDTVFIVYCCCYWATWQPPPQHHAPCSGCPEIVSLWQQWHDKDKENFFFLIIRHGDSSPSPAFLIIHTNVSEFLLPYDVFWRRENKQTNKQTNKNPQHFWNSSKGMGTRWNQTHSRKFSIMILESLIQWF